MEDKPKELWEREVDERIDTKLKPIKRELQRLKVAHDAVANQHAEQILDLMQLVAASKINSDVEVFSETINDQLPNRNDLLTQLMTDATKAKADILTSQRPLEINIKFYKKWGTTLRELEVRAVTY